MDFIKIENIKLDSVSLELIADAYSLRRQVNEFRPLPENLIDSVRRELLGEQIFNSNAIEGNTLTLRETKAVLEAGQIADVGRKREGQEVLNLGSAIEHVQELIKLEDAFTVEEEFLSVHKILLSDIEDEWAGRYRNQRVNILGAKHQPPDSSKISELMSEFFQQLKNSPDVDPVLLASWGHWAITRIHPFFDGNGRMARLWQDLILFSQKFVPAIIRQEQRTEYYEVLENADDGRFDPLVQLVTRNLSKTLHVYVNAQEQEEEISSWAGEIVGEISARVNDQRKLDYVRWSNRMEFLRDAFQRCASQINRASDGKLFIEVSSYPIIEQPTWETLRAGPGAFKTWFFRVFARRDDLKVHYIFFFGHHFHRLEDSQLGHNIGSEVCLLTSEQIGDDEQVKLYEQQDFPITLREMLVINNQLVRKRWDEETESIVYDEDVSPVVVAQDFLKNVVLDRLTV